MKEEQSESYSHVLKYTGIFGGVQGLNIVVGLVRNKLIALLLGPDGMGLASLFNSTVNFISQATNLGLPFSAVRHVSELFDSGDELQIAHFVKVVRAWALLTALAGMLLCAVAGPFLSSYTFSWGDHTLHFMLLAPAVGLLAITGGETAILKGARRLKALAVIQVYSVLAALLISVPVYYFFGQSGIVPVIVLMALSTMLLTIWYSYRLYPLRLRGASGLLGEGMGMVRLGIAFVLAGIMGSGSEMVIRSFLNVNGNLDTVGLYNAGFMLTITYAGMVFSSMEVDYFPRLSAIGDDSHQLSLTVNRQIEVSLLIVAPMLAALIVLLPVIVPLLFSAKFLPMVPMAQVAVFSMYLKAASLPISYTNLARGNSLGYLLMEALCDVLLVLLIVVGYHYWGLFGTGVALSASYVAELAIVLVYMRWKYDYCISRQVLTYLFVQLALGLCIYATVLIPDVLLSWTLGLIGVAASLSFSLYILHRKTSLWNALVKKLWRRKSTES